MTTLPTGWSSEPLAKLGTWTGGGTPNTGNPAFLTNGTTPWVSPKDIVENIEAGLNNFRTVLAALGK